MDDTTFASETPVANGNQYLAIKSDTLYRYKSMCTVTQKKTRYVFVHNLAKF